MAHLQIAIPVVAYSVLGRSWPSTVLEACRCEQQWEGDIGMLETLSQDTPILVEAALAYGARGRDGLEEPP